MKVLTARFVNGHLDLPDGAIGEGEVVTVLVSEPEEEFDLTPEERSRLTAALAQAERGEGKDGWQLLDELRE
jgi:hypothetical protein